MGVDPQQVIQYITADGRVMGQILGVYERCENR
jgi:hypothetical protein